MFGIIGDPTWRYNVAFRPVFDPAWAVLFYGGVVLALWRIKRAPYAFALIWLGVMVLPSVLSADNPSQHRSVGAIGAAYIFPAILLAAASEKAHIHWNRLGDWAFGLGVASLLVLAAFEGIRDYFIVWPANPEVRTIYRADLAEAAHWLDMNDRGERVMASAEFANDLDRGSFDLEAAKPLEVHFFSGADTFVIPDSISALYVNPHSGPIASDLQQEFLTTSTLVHETSAGNDQTELTIYRALRGRPPEMARIGSESNRRISPRRTTFDSRRAAPRRACVGAEISR